MDTFSQQQQQQQSVPHSAGSLVLPACADVPGITPASLGFALSNAGLNTVVSIQNIVATANLGLKLDLRQIALHTRNAEYRPKRFCAVILRIREPRTTALVFASGKMVVTGAKSELDARTAARKYAHIVRRVGYTAVQFKAFTIQNMVGVVDVRHPVQLETLLFKAGLSATYEPECFPGLVFKMVDPRITLLVFASGKVVLTGGKCREDVNTAFENIYPLLADCNAHL